MAAAIDKDTAALQANNGRRKELEKEIDIIIHEINFYKDGYRVRRGGRASWLLFAATHCCRAGELTAVLTTACCITTCYITLLHNVAVHAHLLLQAEKRLASLARGDAFWPPPVWFADD